TLNSRRTSTYFRPNSRRNVTVGEVFGAVGEGHHVVTDSLKPRLEDLLVVVEVVVDPKPGHDYHAALTSRLFTLRTGARLLLEPWRVDALRLHRTRFSYPAYVRSLRCHCVDTR